MCIERERVNQSSFWDSSYAYVARERVQQGAHLYDLGLLKVFFGCKEKASYHY